ncbi:MAG: amidohydrolase family protein [Thermodesulfobacteriota bacterium]
MSTARQVAKSRIRSSGTGTAAVALDHCGFPDLRGGPPFERARGLLDLAELPNLRLKVTSHVLEQCEATEDGPAAFVDVLARRFGAERLLWGSDYSQTHDRPYGDLVELGRSAAAHLGVAGRERFLGATALELWPELRATPSA